MYQTVGMLAVFASRGNGGKEVVLTGNLADVPECGPIFELLSTMFDVKFHLPDQAQFATAIGAALSYGKEPIVKHFS